jgi:hypothetical protein
MWFEILTMVIGFNIVLAQNCSHIYGPVPINYPQDFGSQGTKYNLDSIWITGHFKDLDGYKYGLHIGFRCFSLDCNVENIICGYDISIADERRNKFITDYVQDIKLISLNSSFTDSSVQIGNLNIQRSADNFIFSCVDREYSFSVKTKIVTKNPFIPLANNGFYKSDPNINNLEGDLFYSIVTQGGGSFYINNEETIVTTEILFSRYLTSNYLWMNDGQHNNWHDRWILVYLSDGSLLNLYISYYKNYSRSETTEGSYYTDGKSYYLTHDDFEWTYSKLLISATDHPYT